MTDNEIIKALECCINEDDDLFACRKGGCVFMEYKMGKGRVCHYYMMKSVLDLINRQQAEINRLEIELKAMRGAANSYKAENDRLKQENNQFADIGKMYSEIKAEAVKEFAERFKTILAAYECAFIELKIGVQETQFCKLYKNLETL